MSVDVWLDELSIIHMGPRMTASTMERTGHTILNKKEMLKLAKMIKWLESENKAALVFWRWKKIEKIEDAKKIKYWQLCPCIKFFNDEDASHFSLIWL